MLREVTNFLTPRRLLEKTLPRALDLLHSSWPQPLPSADALREARVVSHRGEFNRLELGREPFENTLEAFTGALKANCWGIELDLRFSQDGHSVVHHDPTLERVWRSSQALSTLSAESLRRRFPEVPSLNEVVERFGGKIHLLLELKEPPPTPEAAAALKDALQPLRAGQDFHFLGFQPDYFEALNWGDPGLFFPVAELNARALSRLVLARGYGGLMAHHGLFRQALIDELRLNGKVCCSGMIDSENILKRELARGVRWLFSDRATLAQNYLDQLRARSGVG